ncbi:LacI family DNA-binding transcriptional regulator [Paenibacillus planticolens]|uniref:Substrate-binding domain-containing protein n=1 Tax=Paenibacillus planticolens TaxID=2654976 RepID=A0ABX1ZY62_9BACL|nr:LacI family DNA-binding transcriptional regulator [Paenibacillus planticolens]NOV04808.1 substrate-binding domain-containing protein [Paenibacillus planticolens]
MRIFFQINHLFLREGKRKIVMLKLKDIAEIANVSVTTVSRVLNNKGNFSEETKQRVLDVVKEYLYTPGTTLQKLSNISYTIGVFIPNQNDFIDDDPSSSVDLNNLKEELESLGHKLVLTTNTGKIDRSSMSNKMIQEKLIDAAIIFAPFTNDELVDELINNNIPYFVTNGRNMEKDWNYIDYNNYNGANNAIQYLYNLGHRNIGIIAGPVDHLVNMNRMQGCMDAFKSLNLQVVDEQISYGSFSLTHGYEAAKAILQGNSNITAFFCFDDIIAFGAMKAIFELNLKIPDHISIVGFDDLKLSEFMIPPLTTVRRFKYDINQLIVKLLIDLISNKYIENIHISLKTELIERSSCKEITP